MCLIYIIPYQSKSQGIIFIFERKYFNNGKICKVTHKCRCQSGMSDIRRTAHASVRPAKKSEFSCQFIFSKKTHIFKGMQLHFALEVMKEPVFNTVVNFPLGIDIHFTVFSGNNPGEF